MMPQFTPRLAFFFNGLLIALLYTLFSGKLLFAQCNLPRANLKQLDTFRTRPCQGDTVLLEAAYQADSSIGYQWFRNGSPIPAATGSVYKATENGNYHFLYRKDNCLSACYDLIPVSYRAALKPPVPVISLKAAPDTGSCFRNISIRSMQSVGFERVWMNDGRILSGQSDTVLNSDSLGFYRLMLRTPEGCRSFSDILALQVIGDEGIYKPRIERATTVSDNNGAERCMVFWRTNPNPSSRIKKIRILRETQPGVFQAVGYAAATDTSFMDASSNPAQKPYYYRIQPLLQCGSDSFFTAPSPWHRCIHLNVYAQFGYYLLNWTPYAGMQLDNYRILAFNGADLIDEVVLGPAVTSYPYNPQGNTITHFQIEATGTQPYVPWGRIAEPPKKTLSNSRPITQFLSCGESAFNAALTVDTVTSVSAITEQAIGFRLFPSPSADGRCEVHAGTSIEDLQVMDVQGRRQEVSIRPSDAGRWQVVLPENARNGLYLVQIRSGKKMAALKWVLER